MKNHPQGFPDLQRPMNSFPDTHVSFPVPLARLNHEKEDGREVCSICLEDINLVNRSEVSCGHKFHCKCISEWKRRNPRTSLTILGLLGSLIDQSCITSFDLTLSLNFSV